jgi:hypothetical protein
VSIRLQLIYDTWSHLNLSLIDVLAVGCHEVVDLLVESDCVLRLICCQVEVAFLLHAV